MTKRYFEKIGHNEKKGGSKSSVREDGGPHGVYKQRGNRSKHTYGESTGKIEASIIESTNGLELGPL